MKKYIPLLVSLSIICTIATAMDNMNDYEQLPQTTQPTPMQDRIKTLTNGKTALDLIYGSLVLGMTTATIVNAIWEEPTLQSDYFGANALSVGNKMNTALAVSFGIVDITWLLKPYCAFAYDTSQEKSWAYGMLATHGITGNFRALVAGAIGIGAGIRRYPRTLTMLTATALLDFAGYINAQNHADTAKEIDDLQNESL